eukprot:727020-Prymnesium_polylepis.1
MLAAHVATGVVSGGRKRRRAAACRRPSASYASALDEGRLRPLREPKLSALARDDGLARGEAL